MARQSKSSKSKPRSKAKARARSATIKITKTEAAQFRKNKIPGFKLKTVRHGNKGSEYYLTAPKNDAETITKLKGRGDWSFVIARNRHLKGGTVQHIVLPKTAKTLGGEVNYLTKNKELINQIKGKGEKFAFTITKDGRTYHSSRTFNTINDMSNWMRLYDQKIPMGIITLVKTTKSSKDWHPQKKKPRRNQYR